jgi:hypothetical protein
MNASLLIANRAFDADLRVLEPLAAAGKSVVIAPREFDRDLYKERRLIENFCCKLDQFRAIAIPPLPEISWPPSISPPLSSGSIDDTP